MQILNPAVFSLFFSRSLSSSWVRNSDRHTVNYAGGWLLINAIRYFMRLTRLNANARSALAKGGEGNHEAAIKSGPSAAIKMAGSKRELRNGRECVE